MDIVDKYISVRSVFGRWRYETYISQHQMMVNAVNATKKQRSWWF